MDEEIEVKAPVTRLRRRLSVEQSEDRTSSPALGTPTKKRGGRKAAKPELDLIDENEAENNLKKTTKKNIIKDVAESESEKPVTPSRRSARVKSNTSIVSDTVQNVDSPRAKRAARRTSQVGSDTEMPLTPARTRRTRKDSTSSIERQVVTTPSVTKTQIPEVITEEPDNATKSTTDGLKTSDNESTTQTSIRKSPRLVKKISRNSNSSTQGEEKNDSVESNNELIINTTESKKNDAEGPDTNTDTNITKENDNTNFDKNRLSVSSCNLINNLEDKPKTIKSNTNKSFTEAQDINKIKSKRHRTKSWTTLTNVSSINEDFYSDNEIIKKKHQQKLGDNIKKKSFNSGSGDSKQNHDSNGEELNCSQNKISSASNKKKKETITEKASEVSEVSNLFQKDPSENIQTTIVMEDSDSNPLQGNMPKNNINEDQCVPVVDHKLENKGNESPEFTLSSSFNKNKNESIVSERIDTNNTCEPMDVDETLPECLPNISTKESENQEKSSLHNLLETNSSLLNKTSNKSKRKSSLSTSQNLEKSNNENKSTLVLSQLKDLSNSENKSPKFSKKDQLSQSANILNITQENEKENKKNSQSYLTSTPLQQKVDLGVTAKNKLNNIFDKNVSKNKENVTSKKNVSKIESEQNSETESESDKESETSKTSNLLENEAEEASDDYESGDSQDEDEKQYEKDNEIVEKGETLTSEDEISNDSDYEKDSFVVTSDEEDDELLSGSGDDLSMSDNELKMDLKSKKKYNARKLKEQKQASREMYESRHKLNISKKDRSLKSSKIKENSRERLDSSNSDKSEDNIKCTKKNKRMRLDSTATDSINISKIENTDSRKKNMDMSESSYNENNLKEKEITISEEAPDNINDPLILHVKEENTSMKQRDMSINFIDTDLQKDNQSNTINSKTPESKNPLEDSDNDTNSSLSTEDENIVQNYNDVLNNLKVKTANHSLNIEKKSKKNSSTPIVDHLNITQSKDLKTRNKSSHKENTTTNSNEQNKKSTENWSVTNYVNQREEADQNSNENEDASSILDNKKNKFGDYSLNLDNKSKKSKSSIVDQLNLTQGNKKSKKDKSEKRKSNNINTNESLNNDDSSDSIDLKLLFSEDSINSSDINKESVKKAENDVDNFIPLKKVEAKTDIRASKDLVDSVNTDPPFFVDTIGNQSSDSSGDEEIANKINTQEKTQKEEESSEDDSNDEPLEVSYKKEQNEKFVKKNEEENVDETDNRTKTLTDKSLLKTPQSEKKRKKSLSKNLSHVENISDKSLTKDNKKRNTSTSFNVSNLDVLFSVENNMGGNNNISINKTPNSEKKKIEKLSQSNGSDEESNNTKILLNKSIPKTPKSDKKKKKLSESEHTETFAVDDKISDESFNKQNYVSISISKTPGSEKKKMKKLSQSNGSDEASNNTEVLLNKSIPKTPKSDKKKKKLSESEHSETFEMDDKISDESFNNQNYVSISISKTPGSDKKKMRKLSQLNGSDEETDNTEVPLNKSNNKTPNSEKKKKKLSESEHSETFKMDDKLSDESFNKQNYLSISISKTPGSEKKKMRKLSQSNDSDKKTDYTEFPLNKSINKTPNSEKKGKMLSESENSDKFNLVDKISDESRNKQNNVSKSNAKTPNSGKKKKKISLSENSETLNLIDDDISDELVNKQNCDIKKKRLSQLNHVEPDVEANQSKTNEITDGKPPNDGDITNSKKRKRSSSGHLHDASLVGDLSKTNVTENETLVGKKKKRKISQKSEENDTKDDSNPEENTGISMTQNIKVTKTINSDMQPGMSQKTSKNKKNKESYDTLSKDLEKNTDTNQINTKGAQSESKHKDDSESVNFKPEGDKNKKRKNREDDNESNGAIKIRKENSFDHIHISRLPPSILNKLDDIPKKNKFSSKKRKVTSTTDFVVEETRIRRNKPSNFLEESIYLNDEESMEEQKKKTIIKKPKVLPFVPTATTSNSGYTTNFKVNVMPQEIKFVAQSNNVNSFKNEYLYGKKIKRLGTYDLYKKNRNIKMSKF